MTVIVVPPEDRSAPGQDRYSAVRCSQERRRMFGVGPGSLTGWADRSWFDAGVDNSRVEPCQPTDQANWPFEDLNGPLHSPRVRPER